MRQTLRRGHGRRWRITGAILLGLLWLAGPARAWELPAPVVLEALLGTAPAPVTVIEPHLSTPEKAVQVRYVGWPARPLLDRLLGPSWRSADLEITFRALDGYVARVPAEQFLRFEAHLVFARADGGPFELDNRLQNEKRVPLAPYYLVWNNIAAPELLADGGSYWPYQAARLELSFARRAALLPGDFAARFAAEAAEAQKSCLACHRINGFGGDKMPIDLVESGAGMDRTRFRTWLLDPRSLNADSTMPALAPNRPAAERSALADRLYDYLRALAAR